MGYNRALADDTSRSLGEAIGTVVVLSAGPGVDGATYRFHRDRFDITKFAFAAPLPLGLGTPLDAEEPRADAPPQASSEKPGPSLVQPLVSFRAGYATFEDHADDPAVETLLQGGYIGIRNLTQGGGVGMRIQPTRWLRLEPRFELLEGRTTTHAGGREPGRSILKSLGPPFVGWRAETLTYGPGLDVSMRFPLGPIALLPRGTFAALWTASFSTSPSIPPLSSWSAVVAVGSDVAIPLFGLEVGGCPFVLTVGATLVRYGGATDRQFGYRFVGEFPAKLVVDTKARVPFLTQIGISGEYARGHDIEGWTAGVAWDFDI